MSSPIDDRTTPDEPPSSLAHGAKGRAKERASADTAASASADTAASASADTAASASGEAVTSPPDEAALFAGDTGALPMDTRRVLVHLLLGPALDAQRQTKLWPVLLRDERVLRSRLHELFLELVVDREQRVAFTRQVADEAADAPVLLRKAALTFVQSALVLFLRQQLTQADARGERAVVSHEEMREHLRVFEQDENVDRAKFERQANNAVEKAAQLNLIRRLRGEEARYEVSPALKLLFPAEEIHALTETYLRLSQRDADAVLDAGESVENGAEEEA